MKKSSYGFALALMLLLGAAQVASATYEVYIVWDEQEQMVFAGNAAVFDLTIVTSSTGTPPPTYTPPTGTPSPPFPTPPPPPEGGTSFGGGSCGGMGIVGSGLSAFLAQQASTTVHNFYLSTMDALGWEIELSEDKLIMDEDDSKDVIVTVNVPEGTAPGLYNILFIVNTDIGKRTVELPVNVLDSFDVILSNMTISPESPKLGEVVTFTVDITVDGNYILPPKQLALYISEIAQGKQAYVEVNLEPNSTKTVSLQWMASKLGTFTGRFYLNPTSNELSTENNQVQMVFTVVEAEGPCALADEIYAQALVLYDEDCESAISQLEVAKSLYEQCGNEEGVALCLALIEKCDKYALAADLVLQGDAYAEAGNCESAILKWESAIAIYESYDDQEMVDILNEKIANCEPEDGGSFLSNYWWLLLLIILLALILFFYIRRKKEEEEETYEEFVASTLHKAPPVPVTELETKKAQPPTPPEEPAEIPVPPMDKHVAAFMDGLKKAVEHYDEETVSKHIKEAVDSYSRIVNKRNELVPKMDASTLKQADTLVRELEDRIFNAL